MARIDRRTQRILDRQASILDGGTIAPGVAYSTVASTQQPGQNNTEPASTNPPAEQLFFPQAREDRDVAASLSEYSEIPEDALRLDLPAALGVAQESSREFINQEEEYMLAAIRLLVERHMWGPRFFNDTVVEVNGGFDSSIDTPMRIINELGVTQKLPSGGDVAARWVFDATEQLRSTATEDYVQSSALILEGDIPLLRGAGMVAREDLIQAERDLVYAARSFERFRREFIVDIANDYFELIRQQDEIRNQLRSIASLEEAFDRTVAQVNAGKKAAFEQRRFAQSVLQAQNQLITLRERYLVALDRFKIRLGLPVESAVVIESFNLALPEPSTTPQEASLLALRYRLDLQNVKDQIDDARRAVNIARNNILPDLNLGGSLLVGTDDSVDEGKLDLQWDDAEYAASVTFGLPLDREIERLNLRASMIQLERETRNYEVFRDNVVLDARRRRREIDQQRFSIRLAEQRVEDNQLTIEELTLKDGDPFDLTQAEDDLLEAENDRDLAIQQLRSAILEYLLATGQMRVTRDGRFQPLPGMEIGEAQGEDTDAFDAQNADDTDQPANPDDSTE